MMLLLISVFHSRVSSVFGWSVLIAYLLMIVFVVLWLIGLRLTRTGATRAFKFRLKR